MATYEDIVLDALKRINDGKIGPSLPFQILQIPPVELYYAMSDVFQDYARLEEIVRGEIFLRVRDSRFGHDHGFAQAQNSQEWFHCAPVTSYEDYRPYVEESMQGAKRVLFNDNIEAYILTSGSAGLPKMFVESTAGNYAKLLVQRVRGFFMRAVFPIAGDRTAKNLTFSNYAGLGNAPDGHPIMRASGLTARTMRRYTDEMNILPTSFLEISDIAPRDRDYMIAVMALSEEKLAKVFSNNLIQFGRVLDQISSHAESMMQDVAKGCFSVPLSAQVRNCVEGLIQPKPQRAQELASIYDTYQTLAAKPEAIRAVWPQFQLVSSWFNASAGRDAREVLRRLPKGIGAFAMGYGSSEGKWNIPLEAANASGAAAPFAALYEFRDMGSGKIYTAKEVEKGNYYELIVTTYSGLVRYNMLDIVRIDDFVGGTPIFTFCGKSSEFVTVGNVVVNGIQILELFEEVEHEIHLEFDVVQAFVKNGELFYLLECKQDLSYELLLKQINALTIKKWGIAAQGIYVLDSSYKKLWFDTREIPGRGASGVKMPLILHDVPIQGIRELVRLGEHSD